MMKGILAHLDECETVVALVDVKEACLEWTRIVVGKLEAQQISIEWQHAVHGCCILDPEYYMAKAERSGPEPRDGTTGNKRIARRLSVVECFDPIAHGIVK